MNHANRPYRRDRSFCYGLLLSTLDCGVRCKRIAAGVDECSCRHTDPCRQSCAMTKRRRPTYLFGWQDGWLHPVQSWVAITSIAGHFCIESFKAESPLPTVDMITEVNRAVGAATFSRIGILGTRTVMETRFYGGLTTAAIIPPRGQDLIDVHDAYVTMAASGVVTEAERSVFNRVSGRLLNDGAEAIMLGGTDLALVYDPQTSEFPLIDCASIHVGAIVRLALG